MGKRYTGKPYFLMRKDAVVTLVFLDEGGNMLSFVPQMKHEELAPLQDRCHPESWIQTWWKDRAVPVTRGQIRRFLARQGYSFPAEYLAKNLGLSLTDYYWIKEPDSELTWDKVNFFRNEFHDDIFIEEYDGRSRKTPVYSPNGSLGGNIEKTWSIVNGERCLIKGNSSVLSHESINEVIACKIHELQGYDNYTKYELIRVKGKPYKYGCISKAFTTEKKELVSAWAVISSEIKPNHVSYFEHFINICRKHGIDAAQLRKDLEYQILVDYIMTGYDRHLTNISILRDADSLKFLRMAPIYDSGGSMFAGRTIPTTFQELRKTNITSFTGKEYRIIRFVKDPDVIDLTKLPPVSYIREMYHKDPNMSEILIDSILLWYEKKIEMVRNLQLGRNPYSKQLHEVKLKGNG